MRLPDKNLSRNDQGKCPLVFASFFLFVVALTCPGCGFQDDQTPEGAWKADSEWIDLVDPSFWRGYHMDSLPGNWKIENGMIECLGKAGDAGGDIITKEVFADFELCFDWKLTQGGNSGVMYHALEDTIYHSPYQTGPEYQVLDDKGYSDPLEEWQLAGADYAMYVPNADKVLYPAGEWNSGRVIFKNRRVEHWLNGEKILEFIAWSPDWYARKAKSKWAEMPHWGVAGSGHIALQDHGAGVWFKNVRIKKY